MSKFLGIVNGPNINSAVHDGYGMDTVYISDSKYSLQVIIQLSRITTNCPFSDIQNKQQKIPYL